MSDATNNSTTTTTTNTTNNNSTEDQGSANFVYVVHPQHAWIPAKVLERPSPTEAIVRIPEYANEQAIVCDGGRAARKHSAPTTIDLSRYPNHALPLQNVDADGRLSVVEDMVDLPFLHEAAILYNLKARHSSGHPYTRTGDIVIAVNPYKWFHDLYTLQQQYYYGQLLVWDPTTGSNTNNNSSTTTNASRRDPDGASSDPPSSTAPQSDNPPDTTTTKSTKTKTKTKSTNAPLDPRVLLQPHVYEASCLAYKGLLLDAGDQSILVSGESGAGKTETVKILLGDLASVQKGPRHRNSGARALSEDPDDRGIVAKVLDSNPLLEAFGNAKTLRNDNSSRFGKYLQLQFDRVSPSRCVLAGSKSEVYLLEKSRVTLHHQSASDSELADEASERTYHVFYQLLAAPEDTKAAIWSGLSDTDCESFEYVGYTTTHVIEGKTDAERFDITTKALELIGLSPETLRHLWRAICVVLQLGNLSFEPDPTNPDASVVEDHEELDALAELMMGNPAIGADPRDVDDFEGRLAHLRTALTVRNVAARAETFQVPLSADRAKESTDAFAKEIYAKTFLWLVRTINDATCAELNYRPHSAASPTAALLAGRAPPPTPRGSPRKFGIIGLLDIFGFETFEVNRFEQLCINYANEKLQQKFTQDIFRSVQAEYETEGIELEEITYDDNTDVLDLVEGRMGLLAFLNEECVRPKGSDKTFVYKAQAMNKDNPCFFRKPHAEDCEFGIKHYAGDVVYDATSFVVKNTDTLPSDLQDCARASTNPILANELSNENTENPLHQPPAGGTGAATKKKRRPKKAAAAAAPPTSEAGKKAASSNLVAKTVWTKFKSQLGRLMETLSQTQTRYIRCIKPNALKAPKIMDHTSTVEQLRCAGVVAAVTISRSAFPNRLEHIVVLERFKSLWPKGDHFEILQDMNLDPEERTSRATESLLTTALQEMEFVRNGHTYRAFVMGRTRAYFRAGALEYLEGERVNHLGTYATLLQKHARGYRCRSHYRAFRRATIVLQSGFRTRVAATAYRRLRAAAVRVQCWHRVLFAAAALVRLRRDRAATLVQVRWRIRRDKNRFASQKAAAVVVQAVIRAALQRPRYRKALHEKQEEAKLENQLRTLQRKLEEAETKRVEAEKEAEARAKAAIEEAARQQEAKSKAAAAAAAAEAEAAESKRQEEEDRKHKAEEEEKKKQGEADREKERLAEQKAELERDHQMHEEQQKLMDESGRMLEYLRQEVFKLRSQNQQLKADFDLLKDNNQRLMDANASAGASFAALNQHAKQMSKQNNQLNNDLNGYKAQVQKMNIVQVELKDELKMKQVSYVAEVQSRLQYQRALTKVTDLIQEECRDHRLVEKVLQVTDECEMEYMNMEPQQVSPRQMPGDIDSEYERRSSLFGYFFS